MYQQPQKICSENVCHINIFLGTLGKIQYPLHPPKIDFSYTYVRQSSIFDTSDCWITTKKSLAFMVYEGASYFEYPRFHVIEMYDDV